MAVVMFLQVPASPQVSRAVVEVVSAKAINSWHEGRFWWHSSGWAAWAERFRNEYLPNIGATAQRTGWDGQVAQRRSRPTPQDVETQQDREQRVARIEVSPGDVEVRTGEQVIFTAIAFDQDGNVTNGVEAQWSALHEEMNRQLTISRGTFVSGIPGRFILTAEIAGRKERVTVTVRGESRRPNLKSRSEAQRSSHESRRIGSLRAPIQGDQKQIAGRSKQTRMSALPGSMQAGMPALPGLRAASAPMASRSVLRAAIGDQTGWNITNKGTVDDVGSERGHVPGRAVDGGAGAGNFRLSTPAVLLCGRGIDLNLFFNYNSRVWHKAGSEITFDIDRDTLVPGWNLGFGKIIMAGDTYFVMDSDGARHPFEGTFHTDFPAPATSLQTFEGRTTDGTFIDY
jgi:hypothetical protein